MKKVYVVLAAALALVLGACGSSSGGHGSLASGKGTKTLKFMVIAPPASPGNGNFPDGVNAAVDAFEAQGGVSGYKIQVVWCNNGPFAATVGTASGTAQCGQQALADHVVAITDFSGFDTEYPYLEKDDIPVIGNVPESVGDWNNKLSYPLAGEPVSSYAGSGLNLVLDGCKRIALMADGSASLLGRYMDAYKSGIKYGGGTEVGSVVYVPITSDDFAAAVATVDSYKPDCLGTLIGPTQVAPLLTAIKDSGYPLKVGGNKSGFPQDTIKQLGTLADGVTFNDDSLPASWNTAGEKEFAHDMATYQPKASVVVYTSQMWAAGKVFTDAVQAAAKTGAVTSKSIIAALNSMSNVATGVEPPGNFTKSGPLPFAPRVTVIQFAREIVTGDGVIISPNHTLYDQAAPVLKYPVPKA